MAKEAMTAKLSPKTLGRLENYADREGISRSEAADRMIKQGLDVEESDMRLVPVRSDGGTVIEDELGELQSEVDDLNGQFKRSTRLDYFFVASMVWIALEVTVGLPGLVVLTTGPIIIFGLVRELAKNWGWL